jgi:hypothetical protein
MTSNNEQQTMNYLKQSQTKPILPARAAGKIALSAVEGPVVSSIEPFIFSPFNFFVFAYNMAIDYLRRVVL